MSENLPNLIIIGATKAGTTSLHYYLGLHPDIQMSKIKELHFFVEKRNWRRGLKWYKSHFPGNAPVRGEATPAYTMYPVHRGVPERMHALIPDVKLVYLVRDPIKRIFSEYMHYYTEGTESRTLETLINSGYAQDRLITRSRYYYQIAQYLPYFPAENIHILTTEDLLASRDHTLAAVFRFLGVDDQFTSRRFNQVKNPTQPKRRLNKTGRRLFVFSEQHLNRFNPGLQRYIVNKLLYPFTTAVQQPTISDALHARLVDELRDDVQKLRAFTGRSFKDWSF